MDDMTIGDYAQASLGSSATPIPTEQADPFPVPDFTGLDAAFGAKGSTYLTRERMGDEFYGDRNRWTKVASQLFYRGGKLTDHGIDFKPGIDRAKAMTAIRAWLCSFAPKHEIKIGTVGFALSQWCADYAPPPATEHQARKQAAVARKKKGKTRIAKATEPVR